MILLFVSVISHSVPIEIIFMSKKSVRVKESVVSTMTGIFNLLDLDFVHGGGHKAKMLPSTDLKYCLTDLVFIKLGCCINEKEVDERIKQNIMDIQFCFKLSQSSYDQSSGDLVTLS